MSQPVAQSGDSMLGVNSEVDLSSSDSQYQSLTPNFDDSWMEDSDEGVVPDVLDLLVLA